MEASLSVLRSSPRSNFTIRRSAFYGGNELSRSNYMKRSVWKPRRTSGLAFARSGSVVKSDEVDLKDNNTPATLKGFPGKPEADVVVIGSGVGGLCAASLLARYGQDVLVLESHDLPGGAAHSFEIKGYKFDSGPSLFSGLSSRGPQANPLAQVVNSSSAERCWSTYSFIHNVKRNNLNIDRVESLVYVHYNLRLLSRYCDGVKTERADATWDNNQEEPNLQDGSIALERLEDELMRDNNDHTPASEMPPASTSSFRDAGVLPLASQYPGSHGGHVGDGIPRPLPFASTPLVHRSREKKLEVSRGKRKT